MVNRQEPDKNRLIKNSTFVLDTVGTGDPLFYDLSRYLLEHGAKKIILFRHPFEEDKRMGFHLKEIITANTKTSTLYKRPIWEPWSYPLNLSIPLGAKDQISCWFGFNNLSSLRGTLYGTKRIRQICSWYIDYVPDRFGRNTLPTFLYNRLDKHLDKKINLRVELTQSTADLRTQKSGLREAAVAIAPIGQWIEREPLGNQERYCNQDIVYLGGLNERLGGEILIDYLEACRDLGWVGNAYLIGSGTLLEPIRKQIDYRNLRSRVNALGYVEDRTRVEKILQKCAIAVAPYKPSEDNFSATTDSAKLKSYAAAGLPIVMTGVPVNSGELLNSKVALVCAYDVHELAKNTMKILNSPETWDQMNGAAIQYIEKYDWNLIFGEVMSRLGYLDVE